MMTNREWMNSLSNKDLVKFMFGELENEVSLHDVMNHAKHSPVEEFEDWLDKDYKSPLDNYCRDCKWFKKVEHCGETYTVCWLPFKYYPNGVNTVSSIDDDDIGCRDFEEEKENE